MLAEIDLLDRDRFTQGIPHEWFTWLRANAPVFHHDEPGGDGFWVITRYDDIVTANRDGVVLVLPGPGRRGHAGGADRAHAGHRDGRQHDAVHGPAVPHTRYRKLVNRGFTPRMIAALEVHVRELTVAIVEAAKAKGECDFVVDVAAELPLEVIAELLGVPREDRHKLFDWSNRMVGSEDPEYQVAEEHVTAAQIDMFIYAQELATKRRAEPHEDIVSTLLAAEIDGDQLTDMDFNLFFMLLSVAGNETTRNAIAHGMNAFLEHPDQWDLLVSDPDAHIAGAVEEILRWASPVLYFRRNAKRDVELGARPSGPARRSACGTSRQPGRVDLRRAVPVRHHP